MSEPAIHQTTPNDAPADHWLVENLKKQAITVTFALLWAFYTFVWNARDSQRDLRYQVEANTKAIDKLIAADKEQIAAQNQFLIALTRIGEAQTRLAQDVEKIQQQQQRNTEMLMK